jgi:group II intron reverse transcriptase/maturase
MEGKMGETQNSQTISTKLQAIAEKAQREPEEKFISLAHLMDETLLREAYSRTRKNAAPGVDGVTAQEYGENLEANLKNLHNRLRANEYEAPPVKRVWIQKDDGKERPIGIVTFEDKIVQRAVMMLLESIYEQDFYEVSMGFRPGRSQHQALHQLREACLKNNINWVIDADVCGFFDNLDRKQLREFVELRVTDGSIHRLIGKWLNAGVMEDNQFHSSETGTPQGGVISPMLSNIYLHYTLDDWYIQVVQPRLKGRNFLLRFADDFIIGCEREDDARRVMKVLPKRFERFGLTIHPTKTTLINIAKPGSGKDERSGTFDFLGFTHYWARSRQGYWVLKRKTAKKRLKRTLKDYWDWCRDNRHEPLKEQHQTLCQKLRGHIQYFGIRGNFEALKNVVNSVQRAWQYWLSRRSHKSKIPWEIFENLLEKLPLPKARIVHQL